MTKTLIQILEQLIDIAISKQIDITILKRIDIATSKEIAIVMATSSYIYQTYSLVKSFTKLSAVHKPYNGVIDSLSSLKWCLEFPEQNLTVKCDNIIHIVQTL